jgi:hypothetical protein
MKRLLHILVLVSFLVPTLLGVIPFTPTASAQDQCMSGDMGPCTRMGPGECSPYSGKNSQSPSPSNSSSTDSNPCTVCLLAYNLTPFLWMQASATSVSHVESISLPMQIRIVSLVTPPEEHPPRSV